MDLNSFIGNNDKRLFKIKFLSAETKITRFISAYSKENAKYLLEQEIKKDYPGAKSKILDIKDLSQKEEKGDLDV